MIQGQQGVQIVGTGGDRNAFTLGKNVQQNPQREKHKIHKNQRDGEPEHILLGFADVFAGQVFLHQVLIQTGHNNGDKRPRDELLEEISRIVKIVEIENQYFLVNFGIIPEFRNNGYGYKFLNVISVDCAKKGIKHLYLSVNRHNTSAVELYKKDGFIELYNILTINFH